MKKLSEAEATMETPGSQRCQECRMPANKGNHRQRAEPARMSAYVHYSWQGQEQGCPSPLEFMSHHCVSQMQHMKLQNLAFALLGFSLALVQSLLSVVLFFPFGMGLSILCHCMLQVYNYFNIPVAHSQVCLKSQSRLWIWTLE